MTYERYIAEAGFIVEQYKKGIYGWIYKVIGVTLIDDNLCSKSVSMDNFIEIYKDFRQGKYGNKLFLDTLEGIKNTGFWDTGYTYYIAKLKEISGRGIDFSSFLFKEKFNNLAECKYRSIVTTLTPNSYCIIKLPHSYFGVFENDYGIMVSRVVHSVILDKKQIFKPAIPAMLLDCNGFNAGIVYDNRKIKIVGDDFVKEDKLNNIILECSCKSDGILNYNHGNNFMYSYDETSDYYRHSISSNKLGINGIFVNFYGLVGLSIKETLPDILILPPKCEYLYINDLNYYRGKITRIVVNSDFKAFRIGGFNRNLRVNEMYFPKVFSAYSICTVLNSMIDDSKLHKTVKDALKAEIKFCEDNYKGNITQDSLEFIDKFIGKFFNKDFKINFY
jgi:hypothetical protein